MKAIPINTYNSPNVISDLIFQLKVKDVMTRSPITASPNNTLREVQNLMKDKKITGVPVVQNDHLLGIVSVDDIITAFDYGYIEEKVSLHMTKNLILLQDDMPVSFAISYFDKFNFHRYPVLNKEKEFVGMVTSRDITRKLLVELNKEIESIEQHVEKTQIDTRINRVQSFFIKKKDFESAGYASTQIKKLLKNAGVNPKIIRRVSVACYELEMNIVVHSYGGEIIAEFSHETIELTAKDYGPGIKDVNLALQKGWSTADEWTRSLGFGAGMGLPNVKNASDEFNIKSSDKGTEVNCKINF